MEFTELTIHTTSEGSELIADVLWRYTNYGVAISDVKDVIAWQCSGRHGVGGAESFMSSSKGC